MPVGGMEPLTGVESAIHAASLFLQNLKPITSSCNVTAIMLQRNPYKDKMFQAVLWNLASENILGGVACATLC